jgi:phosphoglycerate kinase
MKYIDEVSIHDKTVLLRDDFNISLDSRHHISNDERIRQSLPSIEYLLKKHNSLILLSHLGRPRGVDPKLSLAPVAKRLQEYLPHQQVILVPDLKSLSQEKTRKDNKNDVFLLENIRFFPGEEDNSTDFAQELAAFADVYVNDAFSVSHRASTSVVGLPKLLPSYGGLLLKKEVETIGKAISHPKNPFVTILGGAKISSKIGLIDKLIAIADFVLLGGGLANTFLLALDIQVGKSLVETAQVAKAKHLLAHAEKNRTRLLLPTDAVVGDLEGKTATVKPVQALTKTDRILDIGPQTQAAFGQAIATAKTIIWNGPVGYFEVPAYQRGTDFLYYAIADNPQAVSIVGGGETLAALSHKEHLDKITHISTGGGAMLEFIEKGTLPGIEALNQSVS